MQTYTNPALGQSLVQHQEFVRRLALRLTGDPHEADDVAQDLFVRALEAGPRDQLQRRNQGTARRLGPWLQASVRGLAKNRGRAARRRRFHEEGAAKSEVPETRDLALCQEVVAAVLALEEPFRSTVVRTYEQGMTPKEIATIDGVAPSTIRTRLFRAHNKLREGLCQDDEHRERLVALALAAPGLPSLALKSWGVPAGAALAGMAVLGIGLVWFMGDMRTVTKSPEGVVQGPALGASALPEENAAGPELASLEPRPVGAPPAQEPRVSLVAEEHPYWAAVRAARSEVPSYIVDEPPADAELRKRVVGAAVDPPTWTLGETLGSILDDPGRQARVPMELSDDAKAATAGIAARWIHEPETLAFTDALHLALAVTADDAWLTWEVGGGALQIAELDELWKFAHEFEHRIDDFLVNPPGFFEDGHVPHPTFPESISAMDLSVLVAETLGGMGSSDSVDLEARADPTIKLTLMPRGHVQARAYLDRLRAFRIPLPGEGAPGRTIRTATSKSGTAAYLLLRAAGGVETLGRLDAKALEQTFRSLGKKRRVGVLITAEAEESLTQTRLGSRLTCEIIGGCLVVCTQDQLRYSPKIELLVDLRATLTGVEFSSAEIAADKHLKAMLTESGPAMKNVGFAARYIRRFIYPESWDQDPSNRTLWMRELQLEIHQSPAALDAVETLLARWRRAR